MRAVTALPVSVALALVAAMLFLAPVRLSEIWRLLETADARGWQMLLALVLATPLALAGAWLTVGRTLWPWTVALTVWLATLAVVAGRLHHWVTAPMWASLAGVVLVSLAALVFVWTRIAPRR